jgi:hypothetical protein
MTDIRILICLCWDGHVVCKEGELRTAEDCCGLARAGEGFTVATVSLEISGLPNHFSTDLNDIRLL